MSYINKTIKRSAQITVTENKDIKRVKPKFGSWKDSDQEKRLKILSPERYHNLRCGWNWNNMKLL